MDSRAFIGRRSALFACGTLVSRASGYARDLLMAALFGSDPAIAAFLLAFRFANLPRRLLGEGAMQAAFVPSYTAHKDPKEASTYARDLLLLVSLAAIICVGFGEIACLLIGGETARLTCLLLPLIICIALYGLCSSYLNCNESYFLPGLAPALLNVGWIAAAYLLRHEGPKQAMPHLALSLVAASALQSGAVLLPSLKRLRTVLFAPLNLRHSARKIWKPLGLSLIGVGATQINTAIDGLFARYADPSGPAYLWYAMRLQQLPLALVGIGLFTALLPTLSRSVGQETFLSQLHYGVKRSALTLLPTSLVMTFFAQDIVHLAYGHGAFHTLAIIETAKALQFYAIGLWPMALILIFAAGLQAQGAHGFVARISLGAIGTNIALNGLFVWILHYGAASVALTTTVSALFQMTLLLTSLYARESHKRRAN